jgi:hypothetical protein
MTASTFERISRGRYTRLAEFGEVSVRILKNNLSQPMTFVRMTDIRLLLEGLFFYGWATSSVLPRWKRKPVTVQIYESANIYKFQRQKTRKIGSPFTSTFLQKRLAHEDVLPPPRHVFSFPAFVLRTLFFFFAFGVEWPNALIAQVFEILGE